MDQPTTALSRGRRLLVCAMVGSNGCAIGASPVPDDAAASVDGTTRERPDEPLVTADHSELPQIPHRGGHVAQNLHVTTVTFAGDPHRVDDEALTRYIVDSS